MYNKKDNSFFRVARLFGVSRPSLDDHKKMNLEFLYFRFNNCPCFPRSSIFSINGRSMEKEKTLNCRFFSNKNYLLFPWPMKTLIHGRTSLFIVASSLLLLTTVSAWPRKNTDIVKRVPSTQKNDFFFQFQRVFFFNRSYHQNLAVFCSMKGCWKFRICKYK